MHVNAPLYKPQHPFGSRSAKFIPSITSLISLPNSKNQQNRSKNIQKPMVFTNLFSCKPQWLPPKNQSLGCKNLRGILAESQVGASIDGDLVVLERGVVLESTAVGGDWLVLFCFLNQKTRLLHCFWMVPQVFLFALRGLPIWVFPPFEKVVVGGFWTH